MWRSYICDCFSKEKRRCSCEVGDGGGLEGEFGGEIDGFGDGGQVDYDEVVCG